MAREGPFKFKKKTKQKKLLSHSKRTYQIFVSCKLSQEATVQGFLLLRWVTLMNSAAIAASMLTSLAAAMLTVASCFSSSGLFGAAQNSVYLVLSRLKESWRMLRPNLSRPAALQGYQRSVDHWNPDHLGFRKKKIFYLKKDSDLHLSYYRLLTKLKGSPITLARWKVSLTLTVHHRDTFSGRSRPRDGRRVFRDLYWAARWQLLLSDLWHFHTVGTMSQPVCKWLCGCGLELTGLEATIKEYFSII